MTAPFPLPAPSDAALRDRHLAMLSRLADAAMEIVAAIEGQAKAINAAQAEPTPEALQAFAIFPRVARAVRLTLMLQDRLLHPPLAGTGATGRDGARLDHGPVTSIVRTIIDPAAPNAEPERIERLTATGRERIDHEGADYELLSRTVPELIAHIRHELDLAPDWLPSRLTLDPLFRQSAYSGPPPSGGVGDTDPEDGAGAPRPP